MDKSWVSCFLTHGVYVNLYSPRNGSKIKTQQNKHKYKLNESSEQVFHVQSNLARGRITAAPSVL